MVHGLIEGRICHFVPLEQNEIECGWAAEIVKVLDRNQGRANLNVKNPDTGEIVFKPNVPFIPRTKNVRGSWHWIEKAD